MTKRVKIFLAVLLIAAVAGMSYSFFDAGPVLKMTRTVKNMHSSGETRDIAGIAAPHYIITGDGSYEYKITDRNLSLPEDTRISGAVDDTEYASFIAALDVIFSAGSALELVDENAETSIKESFSRHSMTGIFEYDVPLKEFFKFNEIRSHGTLPEGISRITVFEDGSAALYNSHTGEYYRTGALSSEEKEMKEALAKLMGFVYENAEGGNGRLQSVTSITGVDNSALIPADAGVPLGFTDFVSEFNVQTPEDVNMLRAGYFPGGTEFLNEITKADGSRVMMYGIGRDVLCLTADGKVSYKEDLNKETYSRSGFYESLESAVSFIYGRNGESGELEKLDLFIKNVEELYEQGCRGYRFDFGVGINGMELMYQNDIVLSVDVFGKQITRCIRNLPDLTGATASDPLPAALDGAELIKNNSDTIASIILDIYAEDSSVNTEKYSASDNFYAVASGITEAGLSLARLDNVMNDPDHAETAEGDTAPAPAGGGLYPAWHLLIDGVDFWFNAESGTLLSYSKR